MNKAPILVVNTKQKLRKKTTIKKNSSKRRMTKKRKPRELPRWLVRVLALIIIIVFSLFFYRFFIKPYAYRWKGCNGNKEYGVCMPTKYEIHGIDISHYQGEVDWDKLIQNQAEDYPFSFIFVKATEGGDLSDENFQHNFAAARRYGLIRGAYHYFNPETSAAKQARFFINTVRLDSADLPPVLDVESRGSQGKEYLVKAVKVWLDIVEAHYGVKPILYTSYKFKTNYLDDSLFNAYPYWIAHYYVDTVAYKGCWRFWQHTDVGTIPGVKEKVDLNVFNGTLEELKKMTIQKKNL